MEFTEMKKRMLYQTADGFVQKVRSNMRVKISDEEQKV